MSGDYHRLSGPARGRSRWCCMWLLLLLLAAAMEPGCLKVMQQYSDQENSAGSPPVVHNNAEKTGIPSPRNSTSAAPALPAVPAAAPPSPDLVTDALPHITPDPYPAQHAVQITTTPGPSLRLRYPDYQRTYTLRGNTTGLVVNATSLKNGPLWIYFDVEPLYDCLEDVESCRGDNVKTISRPYFTLTVRDNQTREIVAEDGYGGVYSSQKTNRTIRIYEEGRYHLTLAGDSVDITLSVSTGAVRNATPQQSASAGPAHKTTLPPELLRRMQEG